LFSDTLSLCCSPLCLDNGSFFTSLTSGGHSVGIFRSRTKATEFSLVFRRLLRFDVAVF
jgi:hypothetical protein